MSSSKKLHVSIENPIQGCGITSLAHARRYVRANRAEWVSHRPPVIRLIDAPQNIAAERTARRHYANGDGMASIDAVKGLPVAGQVIRLFTGKRPAPETLRDRPTVVISVRAMDPDKFVAKVPCFTGIPLESAHWRTVPERA